MQYWIFFKGGVGGDGFSNFLEHANNITPVDYRRIWRIDPVRSTYGSSTTVFHMPKWCSNYWLFRGHISLFDIDTVEPTTFYYRLVNTGKNIVIPSHPKTYFEQIDSYKRKDIIRKDQIKIYLTTTNYDRVLKDYCEKCPVDIHGNPNTTEWIEWYRKSIVEDIESDTASGKYDYLIDIDRVWDSWDYTKNVLTELGIDMPYSMYEEYLDISKRRK